jgi:hypothetical protein
MKITKVGNGYKSYIGLIGFFGTQYLVAIGKIDAVQAQPFLSGFGGLAGVGLTHKLTKLTEILKDLLGKK